MRERSPDRSKPDRTWTVVVVFGVLLIGVVIANRATRAQEASATPDGEFFLQAPADPGALAYTDLIEGAPLELTESERESGIVEAARYAASSKERKASVDDAMAWAETSNNFQVGQAWSHYTTAAIAEAERRHAAYEAGLSGMDSVGVVP